MPRQTSLLHPFGELLRQYRLRKPGLSQRNLAELAGYDQAILVRMAQGKKDLTGPSGRERVVRVIETLANQGALTTIDEANALLLSANLPPLFERQPEESRLLTRLTQTTTGHRVRRTNLPAPVTGFIGRVQELADIREAIIKARLVTLVGVGGCGKTRLAQRVAGDVLLQFPDGVWYAELATLTNAAQIIETVAHIFGFSTTDQLALEQLTSFLRDRNTLLVLDNCEHIVDPVASLVAQLLSECGQLKVLTTSRERLNIEGELTWQVPPMQHDEAIALFIERASLTRPNQLPTPEDETVAQVCQRLDGIPLAIELAAALFNSMSLGDIATGLSNRFALLSRGRRHALPRHQTLRALIDWSYDLLSEREQAGFRRLAVFVGGWEIDQARQVMGEAASVILGQLIDKSLVIVRAEVNSTRFSFLETIHAYALEKLVQHMEVNETRRQHAITFNNLALFVNLKYIEGDLTWFQYLGQLERNFENFRSAVNWCFSAEGESSLGCQLVANLMSLFENGTAHSSELFGWLDIAVTCVNNEVPTLQHGLILIMAGAFRPHIDPNIQLSRFEKAATLLDQTGNIQMRLNTYCRIAQERLLKDRSDSDAFQILEGALLDSRATNNKSVEAVMLNYLGVAYWITGDIRRAEQVNKEGFVNMLAINDYNGIAQVGGHLAEVSYIPTGRYDEAMSVLALALDAAKKIDDVARQARSLRLMAECQFHSGNLDHANRLAHEALDLAHRHGALTEYGYAVLLLARLAGHQGDFDHAHELVNETIQMLRRKTNIRSDEYVPGLLAKRELALQQGNIILAARLLGTLWACTNGADCYRTPQHTLEFMPLPAVGKEIGENKELLDQFHAGRNMTIDQVLAFALIECAH